MSLPINAHTLTLQFGRFLTEEEWREVAALAWKFPYVKGLCANAVVEERWEVENEPKPA